MKILLALLLVLLAGLQYKLWFSDVGRRAADGLELRLEAQQRRTDLLAHRNRLLTAEVVALKEGLDAVEARARRDLGMVKDGETFYLVPDQRW
jgi:cell division protein FtsB